MYFFSCTVLLKNNDKISSLDQQHTHYLGNLFEIQILGLTLDHMWSSRSFIVSIFAFRFIVQFMLYFSIYLASCTSITYLKDFCPKSIDSKCVVDFWSLYFVSLISLSFTTTTLS